MVVEMTGRPIDYRRVSDDEMFAYFDSLGVPRHASDDPAAGPIPWSSDDMVTFGQSIREGYFNVLSDAVEKLTGRKPRTLRSVLEQYRAHLAGRWKVRRALLVVGGLLVLLAACSGNEPTAASAAPAAPVAQVDDARLNNADAEPQNWLAHGGNQQAHRFSGLDQITPENISGLKPAWSMDFDTTRGQESTPVVVDGVIYVTTAWSKVYASQREDRREAVVFRPEGSGSRGSQELLRRRQPRRRGLPWQGLRGHV